MDSLNIYRPRPKTPHDTYRIEFIFTETLHRNTSKTLFEIYYLRKPNVSYFKIFGCKCFVLNTKHNLGKFDPKSFVAIFVGCSTLGRPIDFNRSFLTIEESMHVKFEESNTLMKNVVEIDFLGEDIENVSLKDLQAQEDKYKPKDNTNGEIQDVEVEPTQPLSKDWRYATSHPKASL